MPARTLLLLLWLLPIPATLLAQQPQYESLTIEQGLSQGMVFDMMQTRDGFLWVATKDGLNRYDGYNFRVFAHDPFDAYSLADDNVTKLFEDSRGLLWAATVNKGLDVYDPRTGRFQHIALHPNSDQNVPVLPVRAIVEERDGSIWAIYSSSRLVRIAVPARWKAGMLQEMDWSKEAVVTLVTIENSGLTKETLHNLWEEADGSLTLFSSAGQYCIEPKANIARLVPNPRLPALIYSVTFGAKSEQGGIWLLGSANELRWLSGNEVFRVLAPLDWDFKNAALKTDAQGEPWLVYLNKMWHLSPHQAIDFSKPDWEIDRKVTTLTSDRKGNFWIGTDGYGLRKINPQKKSFHKGAAGNSVWRLWRSPTGRYFWRNFGRIFRYHPITELAGTTIAFPEASKGWQKDLLFEPSGAFWLLAATSEDIAGRSGFLCRYDSAEQLVQRHPFDFNDYDYARLFADRDGYVWVTGAQCQLVRFDPRTARFDYFNYKKVLGEKTNAAQAIALTQDGNGDFWIGTQLGLVKGKPNWHPDGFRLDFQLLQADKKNPKGLNNNSIACLLPDPTRPGEALWVGTKGGGINRLDLRNGQFEHLTIADGLPDKVIYSILPGNEDPKAGPVSLWCSTNRGLAKLMPRSTQPLAFDITAFTAAKGLQDNEFNTQAYFKATNGELLFGGVNGLNRFHPEDLRPDTAAPPVFVVGLKINYQPMDLDKAKSHLRAPIEYLRELDLSHDQSNLSFEFAALDFTDPAKNRFRYRLVGLDDDWVDIGNDRFAHYSHLPPGRYQFRVQGSNGEGNWGEADHTISITIHPPWYRSDLAYLCYLLLLVWAGWWAYQFQIRRVKVREQLAFEHRETERVKALEQLKTNFFSNVTHEFRTPLTLMLEPLRLALPKIKDPEALENVRLAEANSRKLLGLVNQLLDMAKLESGSMTLDLRRGDLGQTVRDVFETFLPLAEKRGVKLNLSAFPTDLPAFNFDAGKVELVLNNLIFNALKFTQEGGQVVLRVNAGRDQNPSSVEIQVSDTGIGIPKDSLGKVFDRFYQVDASHTRAGEGTGIGLALSKELVELMGGGISVESEVGKGSTFRFWLPTRSEGVTSSHPLTFTPDTFTAAPDFGNLVQMHQGQNPEPAPPVVSEQEKPVALVIEDNAELRRFIKNSISENWQVVEASDGEEGVKRALELIPDIVISDVMMPRKDGLALCDKLKNHELTAHIPIILLTAKSAIESRLAGLRRGADDYLTKPFNTEELLARM
ncbi:MAG: ATP-binding protein, partial [Saprospiraceae bacterium]